METTLIKLLFLSLIAIFSSGCGLGSFKVGGKSGLFVKQSTALPMASPDQVSGLALWMDADDDTTLFTDNACSVPIAADGDPIGCWEDKSTNGFQFTQAAPVQQPIVKDAIQNSKSIIRFASASTQMLTTTSQAWDFTKSNTVFVVSRESAPQDGIIFGNVSVLNGFLLRYRDNAGSSEMRYVDLGGLIFDLPLGTNAGNFTIMEYDTAMTDTVASTTTATFNGTLAGTSASNTGAAIADNNMVIGAAGNSTQPFDGDIAEIVVFQDQISATNRSLIRNYLNAKYLIF